MQLQAAGANHVVHALGIGTVTGHRRNFDGHAIYITLKKCAVDSIIELDRQYQRCRRQLTRRMRCFFMTLMGLAFSVRETFKAPHH